MNLIVHQGPLDPDGVRRMIEAGAAYQPLERDPLSGLMAMEMAHGFVSFVAKCLDDLGFLTESEQDRLAEPAGVDVEETEDIPALVKAMWNTKSLDHAAIESPFNYLATMATFLEHFRVNEARRRETLLSLGSGPGLYEIYLGAMLQAASGPSRFSIVCTDVAPRMRTAFKKVLKRSRTILPHEVKNVSYAVDDMTVLASVKDRSVDTVLCNNALQWVPEWKKALDQVARVMDPTGLGWLHLFIHPHPMSAVTAEGRQLFSIGDISHVELFDELEARRFQIAHTRQFVGRKGTGQLGRATNRLYVQAKFMPNGIETRWRDANIQAAASFI